MKVMQMSVRCCCANELFWLTQTSYPNFYEIELWCFGADVLF